MKYNIGDKLRVINAGHGAYVANGAVGVVTNEKAICGLLESDKGFNIKTTMGMIYRVSEKGQYELIKHNKVNNYTTNVHIYEQLPRVMNTIVKNKYGEIIETQVNSIEGSTYKVIYNGLATIVIFDDGTKGIAKCNPLLDKFSTQVGHDIAFKRAKIKQLEKQLKNLTK